MRIKILSLILSVIWLALILAVAPGYALEHGTFTGSIQVDRVTRTFVVHIPSSIKEGAQYILALLLGMLPFSSAPLRPPLRPSPQLPNHYRADSLQLHTCSRKAMFYRSCPLSSRQMS